MITFNRSCNFNISNFCKYTVGGIKRLFIASTKNSEFIVEDNIILDIINVTWYEIESNQFKLTQNIIKNIEEIIIDFNVQNLINSELEKIRKTEYSFLFLTNEDKLYYVDFTRNVLFERSFNPHGFKIKNISTNNKSLFQVDYNYYLFNFIGVTDVVDVCTPYYNVPCLDMEIIINQMNCPISEFGGTWF